jgi:hypothetical protein
MSAVLVATLVEGEAVLRFPYDERLRLLLRAIPGRRWDPEARVWRVPLDPDRAHALSALLATIPHRVELSDALGRALDRRRAKRQRGEVLLDLARPDENWWFSFATDTASDLVEVLLEHPGARRVPDIGRGLLPLAADAAKIVRACLGADAPLRLTDDARHALAEAERGGAPRAQPAAEPLAFDAELRRDRRGRNWILVGADYAPFARSLAGQHRLSVLDGPAGSVALAALQEDAFPILELLAELGLRSVDPVVERWLERTTVWRGTIEVDGPAEAPVFVLVGDNQRLPTALRQRASAKHGGASLPLTLESWRAIDAHRPEGWISRAAKRCVAALEEGRPAPPAVLELSVHEQPTFVLAPGHDLKLLEEFARLPGVTPSRAVRDSHEHDHLPAISVDPFWVPELDRFISEREPWVAEDALARLQGDPPGARPSRGAR